ncbi:hypothetical protein ACVIHH_008502 [Bradyrhizobium sp. USDA 4518]
MSTTAIAVAKRKTPAASSPPDRSAGIFDMIKRELRRRSAIVPNDGHLGRWYLNKRKGNPANVLLTAGRNLCLVLTWLRLLLHLPPSVSIKADQCDFQRTRAVPAVDERPVYSLPLTRSGQQMGSSGPLALSHRHARFLFAGETRVPEVIPLSEAGHRDLRSSPSRLGCMSIPSEWQPLSILGGDCGAQSS